MDRYYLTEITTKDNIVHQGIYFEPQLKSDTALLWIHGLTSNFYGDISIFEKIVEKAEKLGFGFAAFNNRGHDMITGLRKIDPKTQTGYGHADGGAGREVFEDCVYDIDAGISFLVKKGFKKIILAGHSTGANKACYFSGSVNDKRVGGVILAGPLSDRLPEEKTNRKLAGNIRRMKHMTETGREKFLVNNLVFFPLTPNRYLSLFDKSSVEDVFDYGEDKPELKYFSRIKQPLLVVLSGKDEYADRPADDIKKVFDKHQQSVKYSSVIIKEATHGYEGKEDEFARVVTDWITNI
jgi:pimeloyl-ACP methyl ester carboxylesterase